MADYRIEAYKRAVKNITSKWGREISRLEGELARVESELEELEALEEPQEED
jgi:hypothetical protein